MKRRDFLRTSMLGVASTGAVYALRETQSATTKKKKVGGKAINAMTRADHVYEVETQRIFPGAIPRKQWARFAAEGFSQPACGIVYRKDERVPHGMPLGGVATGFMDIDTDGTFGFFNLFNSGVPTRGPLEHGFLGIASGHRCWVLTTRDMIGTENAKQINYWGHYPVCDMEYELDGPFSVGLRAWCPFIPGDGRASNTPAALFEVHVRNNSDKAEKVTLGLSFPGPTQAEAQISPTSARELRYVDWPMSFSINDGVVPAHRSEIHEGEFRGQLVSSPLGAEYAIGVIGDTPLRFGNAF